MQAKILETPEQSRAQSAKQLAECVKRLSSADRDYYRRRAVQEDEAATRAGCCEARLAHAELAAAYRQLCRSEGAQLDPRLASELAMFRFNPRPAD
jgi:hypothetical protein